MKFENTEMAKTGKPFSYWSVIHEIHKHLSEFQQTVLKMRLLSEMDFSEIAEKNGGSETDVRIAYEIALGKFRRGLAC